MIPMVPVLALVAQTPDAAIQKILADSATAYRNASALSLTVATNQPGRKITSEVTLLKTGKLVATITNAQAVMRVVADGTTIYSHNEVEKAEKYVKEPGTTLQAAIGVLGRKGGVGVGLLTILLTSPTADKQIIPGKPESLTKGANETLDGVVCEVVTAVVGNAQQKSAYQFAFGKEDHFLRRLTIGPVDGTPNITETYTKVTANPTLAASTFTYVPVAGAVAMDAPKEPTRYDERLKVGAEPFKLVGVDLAGKPVSYADYKGKVLLVDFWATWCGPCIAELPNVQEAYTKFHDQGFEILGISLDQENARPKLEKFIQDKNMPWRQIFDGKYWQAANAVSYGVRSIPFTLLIGKDGKIAAVGARGANLAPAIEAALKK
ncbi:redoxin domain-containing protein [Armatimonas sp.]|uniref:redoxin domain-containing protein n=1 Tax=Armatimonas sp. TaxID=1872638 RepID=UPI00286A34B9|nr:redoxin domain-containing protein [Armatimonas sp.]